MNQNHVPKSFFSRPTIMKILIPLFAVGAFAITPSLIAQEHERGESERPAVRHEAPERTITVDEYWGIERRVKAAIETGRITKADAEKRLIAARKMISVTKPQGQGKPAADTEKKVAVLRELAKQIKLAVRVGLVDEAESKEILLRARKRIRSAGQQKREFSREDYRSAAVKLDKMVEAGKVSREAADKRLEEMRGMLRPEKKADAMRDLAEKAKAKIKHAYADGKITREQAGKKLLAIQERLTNQLEMQWAKQKVAKDAPETMSVEDYRRVQARIENAVKDGSMSIAAAKSRLTELRKRVR